MRVIAKHIIFAYFSILFLSGAIILLPLLIAGAEVEVVKIGFFAPITGPAAADGFSARSAAELAIDEINAAGGIRGKPVKLIVYDDRLDSKEAVTVANKLVELDKVIAVVSGSYSHTTRAASPIFQKARIPMMAAYAVHPEITRTGDYIFRNSFLGPVEGRGGAEVVLKILGAKRISVLTMDNDFGRSITAGFMERAEKLGAKIISHHVYPLGEKEFAPYLTSVKYMKPDALFASGYYAEAAQLCRAAKDIGLGVQIVGQEGYDSPKFIEIAGEAAEGIIIVTNLNRDDPREITQNFLRNYKKRTGIDADMVGASSYDAVRVVAQAIANAGFEPAAIRDAIANTKNFEGVTGLIRGYTGGREVLKNIQVQVVKKGQFRYYGEITDPEIITPPW